MKVLSGPFNGFEGVVTKILDDQHLVVSVQIFERTTLLNLNVNDVQKI